jgi:hypothetical protein
MKTVAGINHFFEAFAGETGVFVSSSFLGKFSGSFHAADCLTTDSGIICSQQICLQFS